MEGAGDGPGALTLLGGGAMDGGKGTEDVGSSSGSISHLLVPRSLRGMCGYGLFPRQGQGALSLTPALTPLSSLKVSGPRPTPPTQGLCSFYSLSSCLSSGSFPHLHRLISSILKTFWSHMPFWGPTPLPSCALYLMSPCPPLPFTPQVHVVRIPPSLPEPDFHHQDANAMSSGYCRNMGGCRVRIQFSSVLG